MNATARGDAPSFRRLIDDLDEFVVSRRWRGRPPLFLSAISWGGKLAVGLMYRHPGVVDSLALLTPGFCPHVRPSATERWEIAGAKLVAPTRMFPIPLNDPALFTATPRWQEFVANDPLALREATARFLVESAKLDVYLKRAARHVNVPVLLMLAGKDRIIDNERTRRFIERFPTTDKTIIEYPDAHHTLEFEPDPGPIFGELKNWILKRSA
jgi:alpha-beta hydrolase superfamily lysophospholipase